MAQPPPSYAANPEKAELHVTGSGSNGNGHTDASSTAIPPRLRKLHDTKITFEEYHYYAKLTRIEQDEFVKNQPQGRTLKQLFQGEKNQPADASLPCADQRQNSVTANLSDQSRRINITDEEWNNASRALRTATWSAGFYLITTDILGPYGVGFAMGTLGWGPGIALYTVFGFMAGWSGYLLCKCYLGLDSNEFPIRNYGDIFFRLYGNTSRYLVSALQAIQLIAILGQVIIQNGQGLSQVGRFKLCYAVCCIIFVAVGFGLGQVRTLRSWGWLSSASVYINLLVIFITMGVIAHSPPNYAISVLGSSGSAVDPDTIKPDAVTGVYPDIIHYGGLPDSANFQGAINGLMQGVFAYGGAQIFVEIMAEMRRPYDFYKAMWSAQFFIYSVYLIYGCYVYYFQGQYSYQVSYQGVSPYGWQVVGDMLGVFSGLIAAGLYGNIGIKVLYNNVLTDLCHAPPLNTKGGKYLYAAIVPVWWAVAYCIAAAIPDYFGYVSVISALCVVQFSYSFPPILAIGYLIQKHAIQDGEGFDPKTGQVIRHDSGLKRYMRGFIRGPWYMIILHFLHAGGALVTAGLGAYSAIESMIQAFEIPQVNAFTCTSPLDLGGGNTG